MLFWLWFFKGFKTHTMQPNGVFDCGRRVQTVWAKRVFGPATGKYERVGSRRPKLWATFLFLRLSLPKTGRPLQLFGGQSKRSKRKAAHNFGLRLPSLPHLPVAGPKTRFAQTVWTPSPTVKNSVRLHCMGFETLKKPKSEKHKPKTLKTNIITNSYIP